MLLHTKDSKAAACLSLENGSQLLSIWMSSRKTSEYC